MHYFDPTLDWPPDLLEEPMPDLVVIYSRSLTDASAPWKGADEAWTTGWIQYASADGDQHFINMVFLNGTTASDSDRKEVGAYLDKLVIDGASVHRYRSAASGYDLSTLATAPVIRCTSDFLGSNTPSAADTWSTDSTLRYTLVGSAGSTYTSRQAWPSMSVEPVLDAEPALARQRGVYATAPANEPKDMDTQQHADGGTNGIVLYVVASSAGVRPEDSFEGMFEWSTTFDEMNMW